jgi:hypothetical protein
LSLDGEMLVVNNRDAVTEHVLDEWGDEREVHDD